MIYYIDVDDTLIRTIGSKIIPIPNTLKLINELDLSANTIYLWSRGGAEYCKNTAHLLGIQDKIFGYLSKPDILIDDQDICDWSHIKKFHPNEIV